MVGVVTLDSTAQHVDTDKGTPTKDFYNWMRRITDVANVPKYLPQNIQNTNYTLLAADGAGHLYHSSASVHTWTIPANTSVPYNVGTSITFVNDGSGAVTIAITTDTLVQAGTGATGSRTLAQYGFATAFKVATTRWFISGTGLS